MSSHLESAVKVTALALVLVASGVGLGLGVGIVVANSRRARRERAFTTDDTTALAFHIAKLSQQLAEEKEKSYKRTAAIDLSVPLVEGAEMGQPVEDLAAQLSDIQEKESEPAVGKSALPSPKSSSEPVTDSDISTYREEYKSWRQGKGGVSSMSSKRKQVVRGQRAATHGDIDEIPDAAREFGEQINKASLWHNLNMGPSAPQRKIKIAVIGGGAYGTAMACAAGRNGHEVVILVRRREQAREIKLTGRNDEYLPGLQLGPSVSATVNMDECISGAGLIIHALPAQKTPDWVRENRDAISPDVIFCSTSKGLHLESQSLLSVATMNAFGRDQPYAVLSGPSFAKEIVTSQPTSVVVASKKLSDAVFIQRVMSSTSFRIYASQDTVGVELGGALKNPLALGAGMIEGLGYGINTMSAYVTRSCAELTALSVAMGGRPETIAGLSGVGDLMLTAFGSLSRNRTCGIRLVKGETLESILKTTTVEGVPTANVAVTFAEQCNLHLPIFRTVANILNGKLAAGEFLNSAMMMRPLTMETHTTPLSEVEAAQKAAALVGKQCIL